MNVSLPSAGHRLPATAKLIELCIGAILLAASFLATPASASWDGTWRHSISGDSDIELPSFLFAGRVEPFVDSAGAAYGTKYDGGPDSSLSVRQYRLADMSMSPFAYLKGVSDVAAPTYHIDRSEVGIIAGHPTATSSYYGICRTTDGRAFRCVEMLWNAYDDTTVQPIVAKIEASFPKTQSPVQDATTAVPTTPEGDATATSIGRPRQITFKAYQTCVESAASQSTAAVPVYCGMRGFCTQYSLPDQGICAQITGIIQQSVADFRGRLPPPLLDSEETSPIVEYVACMQQANALDSPDIFYDWRDCSQTYTDRLISCSQHASFSLCEATFAASGIDYLDRERLLSEIGL